MKYSYKEVAPQWKKIAVICAVLLVGSLMAVRSSHVRKYEAKSGDDTPYRDSIRAAGPDASRDTAAAKPAENISPTIPCPFASGDLIPATVPITRNFYASFENDRYVHQLAQWVEITRLAELLSAHLTRSLTWTMNLRKDVHKGDTCSFIFRAVNAAEKAQRPDAPDDIEIKAIRYSCPHENRTLGIYYFTPAGAKYGKFFLTDGTMVEPLLVNAPIRDYLQITSLFNERRGWHRHQGLDFKTPVGTPLYAPASGVVSRINWHRRANGRCLELALDQSPFVVKMLHLDQVMVQPGQRVNTGDMVAFSGNSGHSSAPHLHYQINEGAEGQSVDPMTFHKKYQGKLTESDLPAFRQTIDNYDQMMRNEHQLASTKSADSVQQ